MGPTFVQPGWRFVFDPGTDTVETHMLIKSADGSQSWEITHQTTSSIFLQGEAEYRRCADEVRMHRGRGVVASLPKGRKRREA